MYSSSVANQRLNTTLWILIGILACAGALGLASFFSARSLTSSSSKSSLFSGTDGEVGVLNIEGVIFDPQDIFESLDEIEEYDSLKALVVRINSPGGAVAPTQEIFHRLLKLREKMPVICSLGDIAASGGYYIASACHTVFTNAGTLTGSIGVIMQFMNLGDLYSWAKMKPLTIKAGKYKDVGSPFREMSSEEKAYLQDLIDSIHVQFRSDIMKGRKIPQNSVDTYADGRIFSGEQAVRYGFADKLGGKSDAVAHAAAEAKIKGKPITLEWPPEKEGFSSLFSSKLDNLFDRVPILKRLASSSPLKAGVPYFLPAYWTEQVQ
jgi:protease-4